MTPQENLEALRQRKRAICERMLQIEVDLAKSKREWAEFKGGLSFEQRTALEEEHAGLRLDRHRIIHERDDLESTMRASRSATMEQALCAVLMERGLGELIVEARARMSA